MTYDQMNQNSGMQQDVNGGYYSDMNGQSSYYDYYQAPSKKGTAIKAIGIVLLTVFVLVGIIAAIGIISQAGPYARDRVAGYAFAIAAICTLYGLFMFGMLYGIGLIVDNTNATNQRLDQMNYK